MAKATKKTSVKRSTKTTAKTAVKSRVAKAPMKVAESKKETAGKSTGLVASVLGVDGGTTGRVNLPTELFGAKVNKALLAQSVRVYLANQRSGNAVTKTRGQVEGSTRKIYKQKGTGRARHGGIRAPIFVGGGVTFGPKARDYHLGMSKVMKRAALASALTEKYDSKGIIVVDGFEALGPKTKLMAAALSAVGATGKVLFAVEKDAGQLVRSARNIEKVDILYSTDLNPYAIITHVKLVITKKALEEAKSHFTK